MLNVAPRIPESADRWLATLEARLTEAVARGEAQLPAYPAVALRVQDLVAQGAGLAQVAKAVEADSALAADVLRCANSAVYRREGKTSSLTQAITQIGAQQVLRLTLASGLAAKALAAGPLAALRRRHWIEGLAGALVSQELATLRRLPGEKAFQMGLLHDFGKIVAVASLERLCEGGRGRPPAPVEVFQQIVERQHVALGVLLAQRWGFPEVMVEVIGAHHGQATCSDERLLDVVKASDQVVDLLDRGPAVTASDLVRLSGLAGLEELNAVRRLAVQIPAFVTSFEPELGPREHAAPAAQRPPPREAPPLAEAFPVRALFARRALDYRVVALGPEAMVVEGKEVLPENRLLEVTLLGARDAFRFWSLAAGLDEAPDGSVRLELRPYALDGVAQARWADLVRASGH